MKKILVIGIVLLLTGLLSGCVDRTDWEGCLSSYDNLQLSEGWEVISHRSEFVSGAEYTYFITFKIHNWDLEKTKYVHGFLYHTEDDRLIYSPDGFTPDLVEEVIGYE